MSTSASATLDVCRRAPPSIACLGVRSGRSSPSSWPESPPGTINTIVGSGSLITFPTLLAFGYPAVGANISNNIGMVFGGVSGTWGYRAELVGQERRIRLLAPASLLGSVTGALLLLLALPAGAFKAIVPVLIVIALVLVIVQPRMQPALARRRERLQAETGHRAPRAAGGDWCWASSPPGSTAATSARPRACC